MQMLDEFCTTNPESASGQKKRKKRGKLLFSSKRVLERSRMRASKYMSRLSAVEELVGVRIDFSGEEVTNLASLQEVLVAIDESEVISEDHVKVTDNTITRPSVRPLILI